MADDDTRDDPRKIITPEQLADGGETPQQIPSGGDAGDDASDDGPDYGSALGGGATPAQPISDIDAFQSAYNSVMRRVGSSAHYGSVQRGTDGSVNYTPYGGKTSVNITENIKVAMKFFQSQKSGTSPDSPNWTQAQAAGLVANFVTESGLNPDVRPGDGGAAHDIAQWHMDRYGPLLAVYDKYLRADGDTRLIKSLKMVQYELTAGAEKHAGDVLRQQKTAADAGAAVSEYYERPLLRGPEASARAAKAESIEKGVEKDSVATTAPPPSIVPPDTSRSTKLAELKAGTGVAAKPEQGAVAQVVAAKLPAPAAAPAA